MDVPAAVGVIRQHSPLAPAVGIVAGSGLSDLSSRVQDAVALPYTSIPGWPTSTVAGHVGELVLGTLAGRPVAVARGRAHLYEGYSPQQTVFGVRVLAALGARTFIITNAAGGLNPDYAPGDVMALTDHLFLPGMTGQNPLAGVNDDALGPRFPGTLHAYDPSLRQLALSLGPSCGLPMRAGVYAMVAGPSFETPAEARFLRQIGADAVGMSTAPETVAARHMGLPVLGLSLITNRVPLEQPDTVAAPKGEALHEEVTAMGRATAGRMAELILRLVETMGDG